MENGLLIYKLNSFNYRVYYVRNKDYYIRNIKKELIRLIKKFKTCALCGAEKELELSHIVPKMAVRTLKKSAIGNIRNTDNPNVPIQDSEKHYMLCGTCEDLFSEYETEFSKVIFHPYIKKESDTFLYNDKLFYFITSVSWRSLYLDLLDFVENHVVGIEALECLIDAEKTMRDFLIKERTDIGEIENHIFFFDDVAEVSGDVDGIEMSDLRPNATFHRGISSYTFCYESEKTYGTITNMLGVILLTLYHLGTEEKWVNTKIVNGNGIIAAKDQHITSVVGNEFTHIMITAQKASEAMSQMQKDKVDERVRNTGDSLKDSAVYRDWINDIQLAKNDRKDE